jgi:hypothetical protein
LTYNKQRPLTSTSASPLSSNDTSHSPESTANMAAQNGMVNPTIFQDLQARVDEDTVIRDVSAPASLHVTSY